MLNSPAHVIGHVSSTTVEDEPEIEANARLIAFSLSKPQSPRRRVNNNPNGG